MVGTGVTVDFDHLVISNGVAGGVFGGGAIFIDSNNTVTITNCTFSDNSATIASAGAIASQSNNELTISNCTFSGNSSVIGGGGAITAQASTLTISDSNFSDNHSAVQGGAISFNGSLEVTNCSFSDNTTTGFGGAIYSNVAGSMLTVSNCTFTDNSATNQGGAIYNLLGTAEVSDSTFTGNSATGGGGIENDSGGSTLTVSSSTFSGNSATTNGGGIENGGSGSTLTVSNSTFAENTANGNGGGISNGGTLTVGHSTFSTNSADGNGGGIDNTGIGTATVYNTIVAANTAGNGPDFFNATGTGAASTSLGNNLYGSSSGITWLGSDIPTADPLLGPLQDNGGPTQTLGELPGSPALGAGNITGAPATDQRGFQRVVNGAIDIGAYQNQSQRFALTPPGDPTVDAGSAASIDLGSFTYTGSSTGGWSIDVNWGDSTSHTDFSATSQGSLGNQSHAYAAAGSYTVTVTITDAESNFSQMTFGVTVDPALNSSTTVLAFNATTILLTGVSFDPTAANNSVTFTTLGAAGTVTSVNGAGTQMTVTFTSALTGNGALNAYITSNGLSSSTVQVATVDTTPPVLTLPANIVVEATSGAGAVVTFANPTATDNLDPSPIVNWAPLSGGTFALGITTVNVTATDWAGNVSTGSFTITVQDTPPTAVIAAIVPNPRNTPIASLVITFSEAVSGFDRSDLALTFNGGANLLTAAQSLTTSDNKTWTLGNLTMLTGSQGNYAVRLTAAGSGIKDGTNNLLAADATVSWVNFNNPPIVDLNGPGTGTSFQAVFGQGNGSAAVVDPLSLSVLDADSGSLVSATVTLTNIQNAGLETLSVNTSGTLIGALYNSATGVLSLTGMDSVAHYQQVLRSLRYDNASINPITQPTRTITVSANDGITAGAAATSAVQLLGRAQVGVFRAGTGQWFLDQVQANYNPATTNQIDNFGAVGDIAVRGDWVGDGRMRIGVFRPSTGQWFLSLTDTNYAPGNTLQIDNFGRVGDVAVIGKWQGGTIDRIGVFRPSTGQWFLSTTNTNYAAGNTLQIDNFGTVGDQARVGDWDGTGFTKIGVFRAGTSPIPFK
ncbi:MAG: HYR domain-containing protein [Gemmataceae bacterium]|nr:HYR domain-containing protein [Gemmataceae bacterium]